MKLTKVLSSLLVASFFTVGIAFAGEAKPAATESKPAKCCAKADKEGKACAHACCTEAAAAGKNCDRCGGTGTMEAKK